MVNNQSDLFRNVHHGRNIKRFRMQKGIKQEALASDLGMSQQNISRLESQKVLDDLMLERIAKVLQVPVEELKTLEEPSNIFIEKNNTYTENGTVNDNENILGGENSVTSNIHPLEKIVELYERLLQNSQEKTKQLEQRIAELEKRNRPEPENPVN